MLLKKFIFNKVTSTNDIAISKIKSGILNGIIISGIQTSGRGTYGRKWCSYNGNLFVTIFFEIKKKIDLKSFTIFNCNIIKNILLKTIKKKINIKPPNDILINKKKICGILQEIISVKEKKIAIVGVGINITSSPLMKRYETTFINKYIKKKVSKHMIFEHIKRTYEKNIKYI